MVEGIGRKPPLKVRVRIDDEDLSICRTWARDRIKYRGYDKSHDQWASGLIGHYRSVLCGFVCEVAFRNWVRKALGINLEIDTTLRWYGDGGRDFSLEGYRIQVKGATTDYDDLLVRTRDVAAPADEPIAAWDAIVRAHWPARSSAEPSGGLINNGKRLDHNAAELSGFVWQRDFMSLATIEPGRRGEHTNYVIRPDQFQSMSDLADLVRARILRKDRRAI